MTKKIKIIKKNKNIVPALINIPEDPKGLAVVVHGFTSSKESSTVSMLLKRFPDAGIGMIGIDLPGHGSEEARNEELRIKNCIDSIEAAEDHIAGIMPGLPLFYFGSSFGAYLTGLYISTRPHRGRRAFFRSGAVNMPSLFIKDSYSEEETQNLSELAKNGFYDHFAGEDQDPIRITTGFINDLKETDLFEIFAPDRFGNTKAAMAHGLDDSIIDPEAARRFSEKFDIPVTFFENEGHSLSNDPETPGKVADLAIGFFTSPE